MMKKLFRAILPALLAVPAAQAAPAAKKTAPAPEYQVRSVSVAPYSGVITPAAAEFICGAIDEVNAPGGADMLVVELDTPGGLDGSMREIIKKMLASKKPVAVYVAPQGARAASAGVFISMASPLVAMAPGTNIGAAHPVMIGGSPFSSGAKEGAKKDPMEDKVLNDAAAYMRSITQKTGRNVDWAANSVTKSVSIPAAEAVKAGVADFIASDIGDMLVKADGRRAGDYGALRTAGAVISYHRQNGRQKFLAAITDPNIAMILMSLGAAGLFIELYNPGLIFPGVVGGIALVTAFYSFQTLSANFAGLALILLGFIFFLAEIKIASYGLLTVGGSISVLLGSLLLFDRPTMGGLSVSMSMVLSTLVGLIAVVAVLAWIVARAQLRKVVTGIESLKDKRGLAKTELAPKGKVLVAGELWDAESVSGPVQAGAEVEVTSVDGFKVRVRQIK